MIDDKLFSHPSFHHSATNYRCTGLCWWRIIKSTDTETSITAPSEDIQNILEVHLNKKKTPWMDHRRGLWRTGPGAKGDPRATKSGPRYGVTVVNIFCWKDKGCSKTVQMSQSCFFSSWSQSKSFINSKYLPNRSAVYFYRIFGLFSPTQYSNIITSSPYTYFENVLSFNGFRQFSTNCSTSVLC